LSINGDYLNCSSSVLRIDVTHFFEFKSARRSEVVNPHIRLPIP